MANTIKDVAKLAGVSISTVSRVINDSKPVSPEARRKVLNAIEVLEYKPNELARSLVTKKSNLIGVIVNDIGNSYVAQIVRGIEEVGRMYNYDIILCSSYGNEETEIKFIQLLMRKQVEGLILVSEILNNKVVESIKNYKVPFVYLNKYYQLSEFPTVSIDNYKAIQRMMNYLVELGHKKILYLSQNIEVNVSIEESKLQGYLDIMKTINVEPCVYKIGGSEIEDGYNAGAKIKELISKEKITAVLCNQDELAIGLINYLYDNGLKVPQDISVAGFGDINMASIYRPKITTIRIPYYDIGAVGVRRILKKLMGEPLDEQTIHLPIQLMQRESCYEI